MRISKFFRINRMEKISLKAQALLYSYRYLVQIKWVDLNLLQISANTIEQLYQFKDRSAITTQSFPFALKRTRTRLKCRITKLKTNKILLPWMMISFAIATKVPSQDHRIWTSTERQLKLEICMFQDCSL